MAKGSDFDRSPLLVFVPVFLGLIGVLLLSLPVRLFEGHIPTPILPLIVIYFWSIYAPDYLPSWATFVIGLLQDLLLGGHPGVWAVVFLSTQYLILSQRDYFLGRDQFVVWIGFAMAAALAGIMLWLLISLLTGSWLVIMPLVWQILVTIAFYPLMAVIFSNLHQRVIVE
ncbi:MAG: rod shape-determining protein MreD [bacterium]